METKLLQTLLVHAGFNIKVDGISGPKTISAIKEFQEMQVLPITGIADQKTIDALIKFSEAINPKPVVELKPITDRVTLAHIEKLHPAIRTDVTKAIEEVNAALTGRAFLRISQSLRTKAEQDAIYAQGRTKPGPIVSNAKFGESAHSFGLGFDIVLIIDGKEASWDIKKDWDNDTVSDFMEAVKIIKSHGFSWGGDWNHKDMPHFDKYFNNNWKPLLAKYKAKDFIPGTTYVNL